MAKDKSSEKESFVDKLEKFTYKSAYVTVLASMGIVAGYGIQSIVAMKKIQSKAETVPEKYKKEIVLRYDEQLLHNIDSLTNEGMSNAVAVEKAHTITWEEAHAQMPTSVDEWNAEDCVEGLEMTKQKDNSQHFRKVGKIIHISYNEGYPDELREEIAQKKQELETLNKQNQDQDQDQASSLNLSTPKDRTL